MSFLVFIMFEIKRLAEDLKFSLFHSRLGLCALVIIHLKSNKGIFIKVDIINYPQKW